MNQSQIPEAEHATNNSAGGWVLLCSLRNATTGSTIDLAVVISAIRTWHTMRVNRKEKQPSNLKHERVSTIEPCTTFAFSGDFDGTLEEARRALGELLNILAMFLGHDAVELRIRGEKLLVAPPNAIPAGTILH